MPKAPTKRKSKFFPTKNKGNDQKVAGLPMRDKERKKKVQKTGKG
jgi:hypothetical protein